MHFIKACGLGNDFVILKDSPELRDLNSLSKKLSDRRYNVGCDQIIFYKARSDNVFSVRFFNADGSEAEACGNGTRCVSKWLMQEHDLKSCTIETQGGQIHCHINEDNITAEYTLPKIEQNIFYPEINGSCDAVYIGNPHLVCFTPRLEELESLAPELEHHPYFPNRTNVGFVQVDDRQNIMLRVWERGTGLTPACGTGASAAAFAAYKRGLVESSLYVHQLGGDLYISIDDKTLSVTGEAKIIFTGQIDINA